MATHIQPAHIAGSAAWYALWTASHCEKLVRDQLAAKDFTVFLPEVQAWSRRGQKRHLIAAPMFPGYLFLRHDMDKESYIEVVKARGVVRVLGERWDRLASVPDAEIEAIHRLHETGVPALPHPYLREGQRVRITGGPLQGVEGTLSRTCAEKGVVVLSVHLLQRSVAVQVDCLLVAPVMGQPNAVSHGARSSRRRRRYQLQEL
jgi:transcription antitermination factor NusG